MKTHRVAPALKMTDYHFQVSFIPIIDVIWCEYGTRPIFGQKIHFSQKADNQVSRMFRTNVTNLAPKLLKMAILDTQVNLRCYTMTPLNFPWAKNWVQTSKSSFQDVKNASYKFVHSGRDVRLTVTVTVTAVTVTENLPILLVKTVGKQLGTDLVLRNAEFLIRFLLLLSSWIL